MKRKQNGAEESKRGGSAFFSVSPCLSRRHPSLVVVDKSDGRDSRRRRQVGDEQTRWPVSD